MKLWGGAGRRQYSVDAGALEGDVAARDRGELDGVLDPAHEHREEGHGLADAGVVDAHEAPAARRVVRVRASYVVLVPVAAVADMAAPVLAAVAAPVLAAMATTVAAAVVAAMAAAGAVLVAGRLQLVAAGGRRGVEQQWPPRRHRRVGAGVSPQAARLVGQVELGAAEHLGVRLVRHEDEQQEKEHRHGRRARRSLALHCCRSVCFPGWLSPGYRLMLLLLLCWLSSG